MEIRNRSTGALCTITEFKAEHPNTSFPKNITDSVLDAFGYDRVRQGAAPSLTPPYDKIVRDGVEQIDGIWYTRNIVGPVFTDSLDGEGNVISTAAENQTAYRATVDANAAAGIRKERNRRLAESDWTQLADSGADATAWATYRQSLRDLPDATGWPHTMTWPTEPS